MTFDAGSVSQVLSWIFGLAIASGINLYAAVLTVGVVQRMGWIGGMPPDLAILANPWVLGAAATMYALEFFADKIPFLTPAWDLIHTFIRPFGAALLAVETVGDMSPGIKLAAALAAGTISLGAHASKAGFRLAAHTVPEPTTHSAISVAEDLGVVGLVILVYQHPYIALGLSVAILVGIAILIPWLFRLAGRAWRRLFV